MINPSLLFINALNSSAVVLVVRAGFNTTGIQIMKREREVSPRNYSWTAMALLSTTCLDCVDVQSPIQRPAPRQRRWAEADAEFLKWVKTVNASNEGGLLSRLASSEICDKPEIYGGFASRQKYLRSYTFSKGEGTVAKKTRRWMQPRERVGSDRATGERSRKTVVVMRRSSGSGRRPCSVLDTVLRFLFLCVVKVEVDHDPVH